MNVKSSIMNSVRTIFRNKPKYNVHNYRLCLRSLYTTLKRHSASSDSQTKSSLENARIDFQKKLLNGPNLKHFFKDEHLSCQDNVPEEKVVPYLKFNSSVSDVPRKVYFDVYGCQMNVNDAEIVWAVLKGHKFERTLDLSEADVVLVVTCAIREGAEMKVWHRLSELKAMKRHRKKDRPSLKVCLLGCMAERLKEKVLEKEQTVDVIAGPDSYRDLPRLLELTENNQRSVNVLLSFEETYADITPVRLNEDSVTAFVSIMRGCDNMCTYCIVPFTRGRERSRPASSILGEVEHLAKSGVREVTLLGQNVNSYRDISDDTAVDNVTSLAKGFKTVYKTKKGGLRFADLLEQVANVDPELRIRFTSPHPKDFPDDVLEVIHSKPNICKNLHMPAQSGNTAVLDRMRRGYTREAYLDLVHHIRRMIPDVALSSDFICGFCGETDEEFDDTIILMEEVSYNVAYLFPYSLRQKTAAHRRFKDDVPPEVKQRRLEKMIEVFRTHASRINKAEVGKTHLVLIEGFSKRSKNNFQGRNDQNIKVILPADEPVPFRDGSGARLLHPGDYVAVYINSANSQVLKGIPLYQSKLQDFYSQKQEQYQILSL